MPASLSPSSLSLLSKPIPKLPHDVHHLILSCLPELSATSTLASALLVSTSFYELALPILYRHVTLSRHQHTFGLFFFRHMACLPTKSLEERCSGEKPGSRSTFTSLPFPTSYTTRLTLNSPPIFCGPNINMPLTQLFPNLDMLEVDLQIHSYTLMSKIIRALPSPQHLIIRLPGPPPLSTSDFHPYARDFVTQDVFEHFTSLRSIRIIDTFFDSLDLVEESGEGLCVFPFPLGLPLLASITWTFSDHLCPDEIVVSDSFRRFWTDKEGVFGTSYPQLRTFNVGLRGGFDSAMLANAICGALSPLQAKLSREDLPAGVMLVRTLLLEGGMKVVVRHQCDEEASQHIAWVEELEIDAVREMENARMAVNRAIELQGKVAEVRERARKMSEAQEEAQEPKESRIKIDLGDDVETMLRTAQWISKTADEVCGQARRHREDLTARCEGDFLQVV